MKVELSTWSHMYYTLITQSEKVGHSSFLIYSLAQSDCTMKSCDMLQSYCQDIKPKTMSSTTTVSNRQTPTESGFGFGFMLLEADLLCFLIVHKKQKSQCIDFISTYKEFKKAKALPPFTLLFHQHFEKKKEKKKTHKMKKNEKGHTWLQ